LTCLAFEDIFFGTQFRLIIQFNFFWQENNHTQGDKQGIQITWITRWVRWIEIELQYSSKKAYRSNLISSSYCKSFKGIKVLISWLHTKSCHPPDIFPHHHIYNHKKVRNHKINVFGSSVYLFLRTIGRTIMRIRAIKIAKTISFIFIFCSHIFLRILVPEFLKSCACLKISKWENNLVLDGEERVDLIMTVSLPSNNIKNDLENSSWHENTKVLMLKFSSLKTVQLHDY
jgi:hypothetical protein